MAEKKLRTGFLGFKKSDVFSYIYEMDEKAEAKLAEKDKEISDLKVQVEALRTERESVLDVLKIAEGKAQELVSDAKKEADDIIGKAETEARDKKELVNREIEIKRRAVKNYYINENKKIEQIRSEVERMRAASLDAIRRFEAELRQVEQMTDNNTAHVNSAMNYAETGSGLEAFGDVERIIPIHIIEPLK